MTQVLAGASLNCRLCFARAEQGKVSLYHWSTSRGRDASGGPNETVTATARIFNQLLSHRTLQGIAIELLHEAVNIRKQSTIFLSTANGSGMYLSLSPLTIGFWALGCPKIHSNHDPWLAALKWNPIELRHMAQRLVSKITEPETTTIQCKRQMHLSSKSTLPFRHITTERPKVKRYCSCTHGSIFSLLLAVAHKIR